MARLLKTPKWLKDFLTKSHPVVVGLFLITIVVMPLKLLSEKLGLENQAATEGIEELFGLNGKDYFLLFKIILGDSVIEELIYRGPLFLAITALWFFNAKNSPRNLLVSLTILLTSIAFAKPHPFFIPEFLAALVYSFVTIKTWPWPGSLILHLLINSFVWARYYFLGFF